MKLELKCTLGAIYAIIQLGIWFFSSGFSLKWRVSCFQRQRCENRGAFSCYCNVSWQLSAEIMIVGLIQGVHHKISAFRLWCASSSGGCFLCRTVLHDQSAVWFCFSGIGMRMDTMNQLFSCLMVICPSYFSTASRIPLIP